MKSVLPYLGLLFLLGQLYFSFAETASTTLSPPDRAKILLNCSSSAECGPNFYCSTGRTCLCSFGYSSVLKKIDGNFTILCEKVSCANCVSIFGPNSMCIPGSGSLCQCPAPAVVVNDFEVNCKAPLGGPCQMDRHCGDWARCNDKANNTCSCPFGYLPDGKFNCKQAICSKDEDCHLNFGLESRCRAPVATKVNVTVPAPFCACKDPSKFYESYTTAKCEKRTAKPKICTTNSDCSDWSECKKGTCSSCENRAIYSTAADNTNCMIFDCIKDADCSSLWLGTKCEPLKDSSWRGICLKAKSAATMVGGTVWMYLLLVAGIVFYKQL